MTAISDVKIFFDEGVIPPSSSEMTPSIGPRDQKVQNEAVKVWSPEERHERDHRLYTTVEQVRQHSAKQLKFAAEQMEKQRDKDFGPEVLARYQYIYEHPKDYLDTYKKVNETKKGIRTAQLKEQLTVKAAFQKTVGRFPCVVAEAQGLRQDMEDTHLAKELEIAVGDQVVKAELFGVFDGHVGSDGAVFVRDHIEVHLKEWLAKCSDVGARELTEVAIGNALQQTFVALEDKYIEDPDAFSGTTALVALAVGNRLWVANVGDSRAIVVDSEGKVRQVSEEAKASDPRYARGVVHRGGKVDEKGRVACTFAGCTLAVARTVGDSKFSTSPRCRFTDIEVMDGWLLLACDGLWDVCSSRKAGAFVHSSQEDLATTASNLVKGAIGKKSTDNVTVMLVKTAAQKASGPVPLPVLPPVPSPAEPPAQGNRLHSIGALIRDTACKIAAWVVFHWQRLLAYLFPE